MPTLLPSDKRKPNDMQRQVPKVAEDAKTDRSAKESRHEASIIHGRKKGRGLSSPALSPVSLLC
jgi:hypothetical protein